MDNLDEKILSLRNQQQKNQNSNIETGAFINYSLVKFIEAEALDSQFTVLIPSNFVEMSLEQARMKYPSELRPQCIKTSPDTSVNLGLNLIDYPATEESLAFDINEMKNALKSTNPSIEFYESGIEQLEDFKLAWFEFKSFAIGGQMFNIMFTAPANGQMLQGVFNCLFEQYDMWQKPALQMIRSIRYMKPDNQTEEIELKEKT